MTQRGFTLFEMLIALSIISILSTIAYPLYQSYTLKARRIDAEVALIAAAASLERYYSMHDTYEGATLEGLYVNGYSQNDYYQLSLNNLSQGDYLVLAKPLGNQTQDNCGELGINQLGEKTVSTTADVTGCW
ncbi:MAG: type IV pilin protein [Gammaproteobacteria bacterium]